MERARSQLAQHNVGKPVLEVSVPEPTGEPELDAVVERAAQAVIAAADDGRHVFVEGASRIADAFDATVQLREILGLLEQQLTVVSLLEDVLNRGLTVAIGSETGVAPLADSLQSEALDIVGKISGEQ